MKPTISINFHGIGDPKRTLEPDEAPYWVTRDQFENVLDRIAATPDPAAYVITFDDGNQSDHDIALPALVARGLTARYFVLTGRIGHPGSLNAGHIRTLQEAGMTIGSHGVAHVAWPTLEEGALTREICDSRARLEDICSQPVTEAGIPFGRYDARVLRALHTARYTAVWSSDGGKMKQNAFLRPRTSLRRDMTETMMASILAGQMSPVRRLRRTLGMMRRQWIVTG
ncbi:polysaccharide deacetylase family protein [Ruegeria meonggei]|uniref:Chitooligosaccharide deacetylase n=1 Tax=Ruegeria meonggei TaxID=1446476 RepID=A0A1X7ACE5_9RHOB|nr:polysaccharide deacetylase family protein [Ruegeria meonggei]SLN76065.1 Polysaccharide deacetylase [Ruegeria meonggei]